MSRDIVDILQVLDFDENDVLFQQRESGALRTTFAMEKKLYSFVAAGKPKEMVAYYKDYLIKHPKLLLPVGKLSQDELRQTKYLAVSLIAVVCRIAMLSGAAEAVAYSMSDEAIMRIDKMSKPREILVEEATTIYQYAVLVEKQNKNVTYSGDVRQCVECILANLHSAIALEDLAAQSTLTKEHLAKKFKAEVGVSVTDYILEHRILEAQRMLLEGKPCDEIAYTLHFCSQSYFIRQFKKVTGKTPAQYKRSHCSV